MAKSKQQFEGVPSQTLVPAATRYPHEDSANQTIYTNALPLEERLGYKYYAEDGDVPAFGHIPQRTHRYAEFYRLSHTNGKSTKG